MNKLIVHAKGTGYIGGCNCNQNQNIMNVMKEEFSAMFSDNGHGAQGNYPQLDHSEELSVMLGIETYSNPAPGGNSRTDDHSEELGVMLGIETYNSQPGQPSGQADHSEEIEAMLGF